MLSENGALGQRICKPLYKKQKQKYEKTRQRNVSQNSYLFQNWYGGIKREEIKSYTADGSERVPVEVKWFYKVLGKFKEDITNHIMTIMKQMTESREGPKEQLLELKKEM